MTARRQPPGAALARGIVRAGEADIEVLSQVIADAFFPLAPCQWLIPDQDARREIFPAYFRMYVEHAMTDGIVHTTPGRDAAALWIPLGTGLPEPPAGYHQQLAAITGPWADRFTAFDAEPGRPSPDWHRAPPPVHPRRPARPARPRHRYRPPRLPSRRPGPAAHHGLPGSIRPADPPPLPPPRLRRSRHHPHPDARPPAHGQRPPRTRPASRDRAHVPDGPVPEARHPQPASPRERQVTSVQAQTLVLLLAGLAPAAGTGLAGLAWLARLRFRHRIETIRDDGVLAVIDGVLPRTPAVTGYLAALDGLAARPRRPGIARAAAWPGPARASLTRGQQQLMDDLSQRVRAAARSGLMRRRPDAELRTR